MLPLVLAGFMVVINITDIAHRFNHKPDVRTPLCVILHENLWKVKRDECLRLTRLILYCLDFHLHAPCRHILPI